MRDSSGMVQPVSPPHVADAPQSPAFSWAALVTALQFLTRLPISSSASTSRSLRSAVLFFPFVGLLIGCFTAALLWLTGLLWPIWLAVLLALAAEMWLTGALHEDGIADFCDAFGGGWTREKILEILKDSRVGTYGMLGLGFAVTLRVGSLGTVVSSSAQQSWLDGAVALIASAAVGRWMMVLAMVLVPPVADRQSLSRDVAGAVSWRCFALSGWGAIPALALFAYLMPANALLAAGLIAAALLFLTSLIRRKLGGITGDCLGCIGYTSQVLLLLSAAARVA